MEEFKQAMVALAFLAAFIICISSICIVVVAVVNDKRNDKEYDDE